MFEVKPIKTLNQVKGTTRIPEPLPQRGKICWTLLSRRRGGKTTLICNLIKVYSKVMSEILILGPTVLIDPLYRSVADLKNVSFSDQVNNEVLAHILEKQKQRFMQDPQKSSILVIVDDSGNMFRSRQLRSMMNVYYSTFRHYGGNLICAVQSLQHMESIQITNSSQWCIFQSDARQLKKISTDLATAHMDAKALYDYINENTRQQFSFIFIDFTAEDDKDVFRIGFSD